MNFKLILLLGVFLCAIVVINATPIDSDIVVTEDKGAVAEHGNRAKRATCDLLSGFGVADSACAAGCIGRGLKGGWCDNRKVCHCRR